MAKQHTMQERLAQLDERRVRRSDRDGHTAVHDADAEGRAGRVEGGGVEQAGHGPSPFVLAGPMLSGSRARW